MTAVTSISEVDSDLPACADKRNLCKCSDFKYQEEAQKILDKYSNDPFGLDGILGNRYSGIPGKACEHLPSSSKK